MKMKFYLIVLSLLAVCLCHEIDHLDGVVYVDKMIEDVSDRYRQVRKEEKK